MRIHEFITCLVKLLLSTRCRGPAFFTWLPKMFGKRVVVTVHGECEIMLVTRKILISCGFARLDLFYLNLFLFTMVRCVPA